MPQRLQADTTSTDGLTLSAHLGDGAVLLGFCLDPDFLKTVNLAGFAIRRIPSGGAPTLLVNRLNFSKPVTGATPPGARQWTPSDQAPIQRFHWIDLPAKSARAPSDIASRRGSARSPA